MKHIEVIDTAYLEKNDTDLSFIIAVSEEEYELLKNDLNNILSNQSDYDSVYEAMMDCIEKHNAERLGDISPDCSLEW